MSSSSRGMLTRCGICVGAFGALAGLGLTMPEALSAAVPARLAAASTPTSPCVVTHTKSAGPAAVALGEAVDVTLTVRVGCVPVPLWYHVMLVLDGSAAMSAPDTQQMKQSAASLVQSLDLAHQATSLVGVIEFAHVARRLSGLSNDEAAILRAINRVRRQGETHIEVGIDEAVAMLRRARADRDPYYLSEFIVVFSQGHNEDGCDEALQASRKARGQGVLMIAVCVGADCDEQCMRQLASSPRYYFRAENASGLRSIFERVRSREIGISGLDLVVTDTLGDELLYLPPARTGTEQARADVTPGPPTVLVWREDYVPRDGVTFSFRARPQRPGEVATNRNAVGSLRDPRRAILTWEFAVPRVLVFVPSVTPTSTSVPATPTASATTTPRPATATPPVPHREVYLPIARRDEAP